MLYFQNIDQQMLGRIWKESFMKHNTFFAGSLYRVFCIATLLSTTDLYFISSWMFIDRVDSYLQVTFVNDNRKLTPVWLSQRFCNIESRPEWLCHSR